MDLQGAFNMALSKKKLNAEKARRDYWQSRAETRAEITVPDVDGIIDADGTLSSSVLGKDLVVKIPAWFSLPEDGDVEYVTLQWAYVGPDGTAGSFTDVVKKPFPGPMTEADFPQEMSIPKQYLADGRSQLRYKYESWSGSESLSAVLHLICDGTAPYGDIEPPPLELPKETITDEYLAAHDNQVIGTVPGYPDWQPGDTVLYWWEKAPLPDEPDFQPVGTIAVDGPAGTPQKVIFSAEYIKDKGDGDVVTFYSLRDKAGNRSRYPKTPATASVALGPVPNNLKDPVVPFAGDDLIDLKDAIAGVRVLIPEFTGHHVGGRDQIELTWGTTVAALHPVGTSPVFPLEILVPAQTLKAEYGSATGVLLTEVSYRVMRGTQPSAETKKIEVNVDFSVIGPARPDPDPEWPNPVNTNLPLAVVRGRVSNTPGKLTEADKDKPADLEFALYGPLNEDEYIEFYWDGERVNDATYTVTLGDAPGAFKKVEIPWSYIFYAGNKSVPVHYCISGPESTNEQRSKTTLVEVTAVIFTPEAPTFMDLNSKGILDCTSLDGDDHAVLVEVPDLSVNLKEGDTVTMTWEPYSKRTDGDLIDEAVKTEVITLTAETVKGFVWRVQPYDKHILPIGHTGGSTSGLGHAKYKFNLSGVDVVSETVVATVAMFDGDGFCKIS